MSDQLLEALPDEPCWVDARGALLAGGRVFGPFARAVIVAADRTYVCAVGEPDPSVLRAALEAARPGWDLLAQHEQAEAIARILGVSSERAILHARTRRQQIVGKAARLLQPSDAIAAEKLPAGLAEELNEARRRGPVAASFEDGRPVGFCYPATVTETLWDVAVDTLEPFRRRGHAAAAFVAMDRELSARGLEPVWGALESNVASLALARRLGFEAVDSMLVFSGR